EFEAVAAAIDDHKCCNIAVVRFEADDVAAIAAAADAVPSADAGFIMLTARNAAIAAVAFFASSSFNIVAHSPIPLPESSRGVPGPPLAGEFFIPSRPVPSPAPPLSTGPIEFGPPPMGP
ncbi:hypothetical protein DOY81_005446, partial [Sarcophaga bullata]